MGMPCLHCRVCKLGFWLILASMVIETYFVGVWSKFHRSLKFISFFVSYQPFLL